MTLLVKIKLNEKYITGIYLIYLNDTAINNRTNFDSSISVVQYYSSIMNSMSFFPYFPFVVVVAVAGGVGRMVRRSTVVQVHTICTAVVY